MNKTITTVIFMGLLSATLSGCWLAAGAVGAEGGYIASQENRSVGETVDDQVILASIKSQLLADPEVSGFNINVDVFQGRVSLRGYIKTQHEVDRAIEIARSTKGVKSVTSKLVLDSHR